MTTLALLCPSCAGRDGAGWGIALLLGTMIILPFFVVWIVSRVIRRAEAADQLAK